MGKLDEIAIDELRDRFATADDPKAVRRLAVALAYADGESVDALSRRYGLARSTIYHWLDRFETRSLEDALEDDPRPGRPGKLTSEQRRELALVLAETPADHGYEGEEWTGALVRRHVASTYGIEYSARHARRLLREL